ncbi:HAD family phosphatase [Halanaerobium sp. ST460_2HS_T2]|jgi:HAD superfamily hydrolase (TIGR01509 family)|uniref:HAD family hydrolase n=1 Tax=Halanaerobium sp. ST460_2HS_T2 TaxID=2183914 RepID=UPI00079BE0DC|nr:HAD family phosphatase [Halanaerobium sp. ST460_2HS_T2]KXS50438.1 MAG: HAD-superfamily hydrolase [Halanaerobium sp. T82-1]RCW62284.1 HAD superfamily hydrolase (TIGR01509 family)/HAD superfamily hydrolase (TIGR01549 family) [Halanaerobium sp. ST460_2HS_T2]
MIKGIIFDMDGLMFDTEKLSKTIWKNIGEEKGYNFDEDLFDQLIGTDINTTKNIFKDKFGSDFSYDKMRKRKCKIMAKKIEKEGVPIKKGLNETIKYLKENDYRIAVASSSSKETIEFYLRSVNLNREIDFIIGGDEVKESKPNPEIFNKCCEKMNINKKEILILEDSINGILAADKANMNVVLIEDIVSVPKKVKKLTYKELNHLAELPLLLEKINN